MTRDLMAPDTEPTDEELSLVMSEARDSAVRRRRLSKAWITQKIENASRLVEEEKRHNSNG